MRLFSTILLSLLLIIPAFANTDDVPIHPFTYVTSQESDFDIQVVDLNTGEIIHSIATDSYECPRSISPNQQYLHYAIGGGAPFENMLLDIHTGETIELPTTNREGGIWSADSKQLAYRTHDEDYNTLLNIYDVVSDSVRTIFQDNIIIYQWHDDELVFVTLDTETPLLEIFSWNGEDVEQIQVIDSISSILIYNMVLSPDTSYLSVNTQLDVGEPKIYYLIHIETGHIRELDSIPDYGRIVWHPSELMFAVMGERVQVALYDLENDTVEMIDHNIHGFHHDISWSPDGEYLVYQYEVPGGTALPRIELLAYQLDNQESFSIDTVSTFSGHIRWVSETQLIYTYASSRIPPDYSLTNLVFYDLSTNERIYITDTQDIGEDFSCRYG